MTRRARVSSHTVTNSQSPSPRVRDETHHPPTEAAIKPPSAHAAAPPHLHLAGASPFSIALLRVSLPPCLRLTQQRRNTESDRGHGGLRPRVLAVQRHAAPADGRLLGPLPRRLHLVPRHRRPAQQQQRPIRRLRVARRRRRQEQRPRRPQTQRWRTGPHRLREARLRRRQGRPLQQPPHHREGRVRVQQQQRRRLRQEQQQQRPGVQQDGELRLHQQRQQQQRRGEELLQQVRREGGEQQQPRARRRQEGRGVRQEEARQERGQQLGWRGGHGQAVQDAAGVGGAAAGPGHRWVHLRLQQRHHGREPQEGALRAAVEVQGLGAGHPPRAASFPLQLLHPPAPRHLRGRELRRDQHRPGGVGGQEVPRRVALPCTGAGGNAEDLRPTGGGRLPSHPPPLRRTQVQAGALRRRGPRPPRHLRRQGRRLILILIGSSGTQAWNLDE